jgi:hypothetical protein
MAIFQSEEPKSDDMVFIGGHERDRSMSYCVAVRNRRLQKQKVAENK